VLQDAEPAWGRMFFDARPDSNVIGTDPWAFGPGDHDGVSDDAKNAIPLHSPAR